MLVARRWCAQDAIKEGKRLIEENIRMLFKMLDELGCRIPEDPSEYGGTAEEEEDVELHES